LPLAVVLCCCRWSLLLRLFLPLAVALASEIGPGFSPDIKAKRKLGLQPLGRALCRLAISHRAIHEALA
jgi:hypothetical protein